DAYAATSTPPVTSTRRARRKTSPSTQAILIPCASLIHFPSLHLLPRARVELSSSRAAAGATPNTPSPSRLDSSCPEPLHLTLHLLHPSPSSAEPYAGRIGPAIAGR